MNEYVIKTAPRPQPDGKRLLVVDENAPIRRILSTLGEEWGLRPTTRQTGREALPCSSAGEKFYVAILNVLVLKLDDAILACDDSGAAPVVIATAPAGETQPDRLLLAENNLVNQKVVLHLLAKLGFRTGLAADALEATRLLEETFSDRAHRPWIFTHTANAIECDRGRCLAAGREDYLTKPIKAAGSPPRLTGREPPGY
jgi:CheY-like chemotaxis protein